MTAKGKWKIKLSEVPNSVPIHHYIFEKTDFLIQTKKFKQYFPTDYISTSLNYNFNQLKQDIKEGLDLFGSYPFQYYNKKPDMSYLSTSLNFNPNSIDKISNDPHQGTLGSSIGEFKSIDQYRTNQLGKNTYNDTLSFYEKTDLSKYKSLGLFLNGLSRTMIRSRISILDGSHKSTKDISYGWHNDELIFLNLRINIPIESTDNYFIQILNNQSLTENNIIEFNLKPGLAYAYDTNKYHRAICKENENTKRINLILGISPWFDFNSECNQWVSNEFYGEMHPFEMLQTNRISKYIGK